MRRASRRRAIGGSRLIALVFAGLILLGTGLLCLPAASRDGACCGLRTALFTATSATCVTGLALADTWSQWSGFGQIVLLALIELGGLGFMSAASLVIFALRRRVNMQQQMVIAQAISSDNVGDAERMQKRVLCGSLLLEGCGAAILTLRFLPCYGLGKALELGVFHAVSAFCNAGFDIMGFEQPGSSMALYHTDPVVCLTLCALVALGGLGFLVWDEVLRNPRRWSVYTRLVLLSSGVLTFGGMALFCLFEWGNPATLGPLSPGAKLLAALFQSVTTRTAGFAGLSQAGLGEPGKALTMFLMLIGGSSGSTAGGLKTVTLVVLALFLWSRLRGRQSVSVFCRTIPDRCVLDALTVFGLMIGLSFLGGVVLCATSPVSFTDALYEAVSAIATVGLTTGITTELSLPAHLLLIVYMYFGRVGLLTLSLGFLQRGQAGQQYQYAPTNLLIG